MALVKFVAGSASQFASLDAKDQDTLYFITDERRIYKGDVPYSGGIYTTVTEFPQSGVVNTLYINTNTGQVSYWNGTTYQTVVAATGKTISGTGDDNHLATTKAVVDYVTAQLTDLDVSALEGRVGTLETQMGTANGNITDLQGRMTTTEGEIDQAQTDIDAAEAAIATLNGEEETAGSVKNTVATYLTWGTIGA